MNIENIVSEFCSNHFDLFSDHIVQKNIQQFFYSYPPKTMNSINYLFQLIITLTNGDLAMDVDTTSIPYFFSMERDYTDVDFTNSIHITNDKLILFVHLSKGICPINYIFTSNINVKYQIFNYLNEQYGDLFRLDVSENIIDFDCKILHHLFHFLNFFNSADYSIKNQRKTPKNKENIAHMQKNLCNCCHQNFGKNYDIDHIIELGYFGNNEEYNFQALCLNCHREKTRYNLNIKSKYK